MSIPLLNTNVRIRIEPHATSRINNISYLWQRSLDGITWTNIESQFADRYLVTNDDIGYKLRGGIVYQDSSSNVIDGITYYTGYYITHKQTLAVPFLQSNNNLYQVVGSPVLNQTLCKCLK